MAFSILNAFSVISSFPIILGDILQRTAAVAIDQLGTDGEQFVKSIVHGEKMSDNPGYLLFTAPYKLCEGGCKDDENNFAMVFPMYVGKKGKEKYKELYERDHKKIHATKLDAPFKKRSTKKLFTLCPNQVTKETTLASTETETIETSTIIPTTSIPTTTVTETAITNTPTDFETTMTESSTMIPKTKTLIVSEKKSTLSETILTAASTTETPTIFPTDIPSTVALTTSVVETTTTEKEMPTVVTTVLQTEPNIENIISTTVRESAETEDITFEAYKDDNEDFEEETTFVTNANGIRCPPRVCKNKIKVTPSIITLGRFGNENEKLDMRNAQWNSDYSDLQDYSDLYV